MFSFLARLSVGAAYQLMKSHIVSGYKDGKERAGYLMKEKEAKYKHLGKVIMRTPLPFPIRTYDLNTQFQRECCALSHTSLYGVEKTTGYYGMPMFSALTEQVLKDVIVTSLIVRTAGRVEHLREYLEYTQVGAGFDGNGWKRMFTSLDC